jgi:hypothetical protein
MAVKSNLSDMLEAGVTLKYNPSDFEAYTVSNAAISHHTMVDTINNLKEELMPKEILFIAPNRKYAETVVRTLQRDLEKKGVISNTKVESHTLWVFTAAVTVRLNWWDPVSWHIENFKGYHALFGKKELAELVKDKYREWCFHTPKQSLARWIIEQNTVMNDMVTEKPRTKYIPEIKTVHFNYPATVVIWEDGTKTIVKCQQDDFYSPETGLALCIAKKALGNKSNFNNEFKKWLPDDHVDMADKTYSSMKDLITDLFGKPTNIYTVED